MRMVLRAWLSVGDVLDTGCRDDHEHYWYCFSDNNHVNSFGIDVVRDVHMLRR